MKRRDFLKTAGATTALGVLAGCREREVVFLAQSVKRQTVRDGWRPWICSQCAGGCGAQVRIAGAEAKKIEGAKDDPSSRGGLCALGQSTLQEHYDPDRPRSPKVAGQESSWDDAIGRVTELLAECEGPDDLLIVTQGDAALAVLANRVALKLGARGGFDLVDDGSLIEAEASELVFGRGGIPGYVVEDADLIVTFGAEALDSWRNPVYFARALADRDAETLHVHVGPRMSLTAANADLWLAPSPGSLGVLAQAVGSALTSSSEGDLGDDLAVDLAEASKQCDVSLPKLKRLVSRMDSAERAIVIAGAEGCGSKAVGDVAAVLALNHAVGAVEGGRVIPRGGATIVPEVWEEEGMEVAGIGRLLDRLKQAKVAILVGAEPHFVAPGSADVRSLLDGLEGVVVVTAEATASAGLADVVLPAHSSIERLQAVVSEPGGRSVGLSAPVLPPLWDTWHPGDILLALGAAGGGTLAESYDDYLVDLLAPALGDDPAARKREFRKALGRQVELGPTLASVSSAGDWVSGTGEALVSAPPPTTEPSNPAVSLELAVFSSVKHREGRGLNRPWLQELPDPMSTVMWQCWAQISDADAATLGVHTGDWLRVSASGSSDRAIDLPAVVLPFVRPGVVEVPRAYGVAEGRFASGRGANVLDLVEDQRVGSRGAVHLSAKVTVERLPEGDRSSVAIYGRGLRQSEHLPRGWGAHGDAPEGAESSSQHVRTVPLRTPSSNSEPSNNDSGASS